MEQETFWSLLHNKAHIELELFLMIVFDGIVGALLWPWLKKHLNHHFDKHCENGPVPSEGPVAGSTPARSTYWKTMDTLPTEGVDVLLYVPGTIFPVPSTWQNGKWSQDYSWITVNHATHWMDLPKAP